MTWKLERHQLAPRNKAGIDADPQRLFAAVLDSLGSTTVAAPFPGKIYPSAQVHTSIVYKCIPLLTSILFSPEIKSIEAAF